MMSYKKRGRPRGRYHSTAEVRLLEYLSGISVQHGIDPDKFFACFVEAHQFHEAVCGKLVIRCRNKTKDSAVFLITNGYQVVAQFSMPNRILKGDNPLGAFVKSIRKPTVENAEIRPLRIRHLKSGMKRIKLTARVLKISEPKRVYTKFGTSVNLASASITDETGTITLTLWNQQINAVSVGDVIQIENAQVTHFMGKKQLRLGKKGKIGIIKDSDGLD